VPSQIELWEGGARRAHHRVVYTRVLKGGSSRVKAPDADADGMKGDEIFALAAASGADVREAGPGLGSDAKWQNERQCP